MALIPYSLLFLIPIVAHVQAEKILLYPFGHCVNSHLLNMEKMAAILLSAGHEVTMLVPATYKGPYSQSNALAKLEVQTYQPPPEVKPVCNFESLETFLTTPIPVLIRAFYKSTLQYCDALLHNRPLLDRLKSHRFDLAIYDAVDHCSKVLASFLDISFIAFHTHGLDTVLPRNPAHLPAMITTFSDHMSFWQRLLNTGAFIVQRGISHLSTQAYENLRVSHNLTSTLTLDQRFSQAALKFVLGDFGLDYVGPIHPTTILIGGLIHGDAQKIPHHLKIFLEEAKVQGVVVVSFGSLIKKYDHQWQILFITALACLPYKVLWKYEGEMSAVKVPSNVFLTPWFPQAEVLAHPSIKVFVTHCGWNSAYESAFNGVPVVAIPLFGDQYFQATKITKRAKLGIQLDIAQLTSEKLSSAILHVATSDIYRQNANYISFIMQKRIHSQRHEILHWVDLVTKLNGTGHFRSHDLDIPWYQLFLLDIIAFAFLVMLVSLIVLYWLCIHFCIKPSKILYRSYLPKI